MSSDNGIFVMKWFDEWFVWHGSLSADYYEPASYENGFQFELEASEFAHNLHDEIGYVEGGIIHVTTEAQEDALTQHIKYLTNRLESLRKNGSQFPESYE